MCSYSFFGKWHESFFELQIIHAMLCLRMLSLFRSQLKLNNPTSLKYLDLSRCYNYKLSKPLLASCFSLQKLSLEKSCLNFDMAKSIGTQNWTTLQSLDLHDSQGLKEDVIQVIVKNCTKLEEFSFSTLFMTCEAIGNSNS